MGLTSRSKRLLVVALLLAVTTLVPVPLTADHFWGYHWKRTSRAEVVLGLGDNVSSVWNGYLATAAADWDQSFDLDVTVVPGAAPSPRPCRPTPGRIEVCNAAYGNNGWLGMARIWVNGLHIVSASMQLNDTYFIDDYDTAAWRQFVTCQEVGHVLGLDHTDEDIDNPNEGTCMDYTSEPAGGGFWADPNIAPNQHDYEELARIYAHVDGGGGAGRTGGPANVIRFNPDVPDPQVTMPMDDSLGDLLRRNRRSEVYRLNLGNGSYVFTFVIRIRGV